MKRLVICCDGTWQQLASPCPTNVVKIAQGVKSTCSLNIPQLVFYNEGIGTENPIAKIFGGAFGKGIDQNIQDCYRFLCLNYEPGDEIYLFGFSRGAYTVRSLAGMIFNSGLLPRDKIRQAPEAYQRYRSRKSEDKPDSDKMEQFRQENNAEQVPITLLGCWDTVGSLGIPNIWTFFSLDQKINQKYAFHDTSLSPIIKNALHAVAIDEQRQVFDVTPMEISRRNEYKGESVDQFLRQVWFPGGHGAVGGGTMEQSGFSDGALQWMIDSIEQLRQQQRLGIELDPTVIEYGIHPDPTIKFSAEPQTLIGRLTFKTGRKMREVSDDFDDLHESVKQRWQKVLDYRPSNLAKFKSLLDKDEGI
ncbi:MAG: DUF2235 domain-containing protein [Coleofasciculus sp. G1-WW12-02]|uniref:DUF2235 domain-containing protein n=1 Tax=unclassified Coleofasciculus TaxID=2692782 RepID=UPI0032F463E5